MLLPLNAFLLRRTATPATALGDLSENSPSLFCWNRAGWDQLDWQDLEIAAGAAPGDMLMVIMANTRKSPTWQEFIHREVRIVTFESGSTSYGAVIFCATATPGTDELRWIAWGFGSGSRTLSRWSHDPRFGLNIALNILASSGNPRRSSVPQQRANRGPQFREMRYRTTAPYFQQTGHRASRDIPVEGFRVDRASDLVAAIGGRTELPNFRDVLGGRSLKFRRHQGT